jgi:hypothetical protein
MNNATLLLLPKVTVEGIPFPALRPQRGSSANRFAIQGVDRPGLRAKGHFHKTERALPVA